MRLINLIYRKLLFGRSEAQKYLTAPLHNKWELFLHNWIYFAIFFIESINGGGNVCIPLNKLWV